MAVDLGDLHTGLEGWAEEGGLCVRLCRIGREGVPGRVCLGLAGNHPAFPADITSADRG